jgi:hypothetical protein
VIGIHQPLDVIHCSGSPLVRQWWMNYLERWIDWIPTPVEIGAADLESTKRHHGRKTKTIPLALVAHDFNRCDRGLPVELWPRMPIDVRWVHFSERRSRRLSTADLGLAPRADSNLPATHVEL